MKLNLQLFAGEEPEELDLIDPDEPEDDVLDPEPETDPEVDEVDEPEADPEPEPEPEPKEPDDSTPWVKRRLARAERSFERKFLEEAGSQSDGVPVQRDDIPKAVRLWNLLKYNPELSSKVEELIGTTSKEGKVRALNEVRPDAKVDEMNTRFELKEAELELRFSDPVFKKYEQDIKDWAEEEGLDIRNAKTLKLAYRAWRGENPALLVPNKPKASPAKAQAKAQTRKSAALASGRAPVKSAPITDYKNASDADILRSMGLNLFTDEE